MTMAMGCATSNARDPGWELDAGVEDANVATPSLAYEIPPQCPNGYASTYPPGQACMGTGVRAHCSGTRGTGYPSFCAGPCVIPATSTPEICDGIDNDCDGLLNENPSVLCDDGRGCTSDSCLGAVGCASSTGLSTCQEIWRPTAESRIAPDGYTWLMRRDNPRLVGRVFSQVQSQTGTMGNFTRTMSPSAGRVVGYGTNVFEPEAASPGWLWSENAVPSAGAVGNFRAPRMLLPATGVVDVGLIRHPAASGAAFEEVDWHYMQLAPEVLLVPVRVTVFTNGTNTWSESVVRQILDPARVETTGASGGSTAVSVTSHELFNPVSPDDIWTQCNIQFRMVDYIEEPNATLATTLTNSCECGVNGIVDVAASRPIRLHITNAPQNVVNVFVGGSIGGCPGEDAVDGIACGASNSGFNGGCAMNPADSISHVTGGGRDFILINRLLPFGSTRQTVLAHELGHFIGLVHSPNGSISQCLPGVGGNGDTVGVPSLLMNPGQVAPTSVNITPMQCARARCTAARWLERFSPSPASAARREAVCAE